MVSITKEDLAPVPTDTALRILAYANTIAPLDSIPEAGDKKATAVAILRAAAAEIPKAGSRRTRSMSRNGTSMTFDAISSAFSSEDRTALRALAGVEAAAGLPAGSFPISQLGRIWPEGEYR
ncbi:hypothetical protein EDF35_1933 [Rathayibacter sp. PhB151]|nr:hypothetical protein EDF35_1933 [Rathayibacter sp. PhB151]